MALHPMVGGFRGKQPGPEVRLQRRLVHVGVEGRPVAVAYGHQEGADVACGVVLLGGRAGAEQAGGNPDSHEAEPAAETWA